MFFSAPFLYLLIDIVAKKSKEPNFNGPYNRFIYALISPETKRQYLRRIEVFLNFIDIEGLTIQEKLYNLCHKAKSNTQWLHDYLIEFITFQKERIGKGKGKMSASTVSNYIKPIKLFCDMNNIVINWKIITKGMSKMQKILLINIETKNPIIFIICHLLY